MSDDWTHQVCWPCWIDENPDRAPVVVKRVGPEPYLSPCCRCGRLTGSGIWVRGAPTEYICGGRHAVNSLTWLLANRMVGTWLEPLMIGSDEITQEGLDASPET